MKDMGLLIAILKDQVKPALGCTEPAAVALAVARAKELLSDDIERIEIKLNSNVLKNGLGVGIPGTNERGIVFAAALGLVVGKSAYGLEVLKDVDEESTSKALEIEKSGRIKVELDKEADKLYISVEAFTKNDKAKIIIKNSHTNIVFESKNEVALFNKELLTEKSLENGQELAREIKYEIQNFEIADLVAFASQRPLEDIQFIQDGIDMNLRLAEIGINQKLGMGYGVHLASKIRDTHSKARAYTAGASEARMSGYPLPVMSSAGSGNHGLVAIIPLTIIGKEDGKSDEMILRSVCLSHLITIFVKSYIGSLSPVCGCGVAAGVGAAAGLSFLKGGIQDQIEKSISNMIAGVTGMICDGAKLGCAYKLAISFDAAVDASDMALADIFVPFDNGILGETAEQSILNLAEISNKGMHDTDSVILDVMLNHC